MEEIILSEVIITALWLMVPLILSGSFHMLVVRKNWLSSWAIPIHVRAFGRNKTWRGVVVMILGTIPGTVLLNLAAPLAGNLILVDITQVHPLLLGALLGLGYVIAELPNSYLKRRLNIPPGQQASRHAFWFTLLDQADSAIGCALVYAILTDIPIAVFMWIILLGPLVHLIANVALYSAGLRKHPF